MVGNTSGESAKFGTRDWANMIRNFIDNHFNDFNYEREPQPELHVDSMEIHRYMPRQGDVIVDGIFIEGGSV